MLERLIIWDKESIPCSLLDMLIDREHLRDEWGIKSQGNMGWHKPYYTQRSTIITAATLHTIHHGSWQARNGRRRPMCHFRLKKLCGHTMCVLIRLRSSRWSPYTCPNHFHALYGGIFSVALSIRERGDTVSFGLVSLWCYCENVIHVVVLPTCGHPSLNTLHHLDAHFSSNFCHFI